MPLNEDQAMIQRDRIKHAYPDVHVDIQFDNQSGVLAYTLWPWRKEDVKSVPLKSEAEVSQWLHKQSGGILMPELRDTIGQAVYAVWVTYLKTHDLTVLEWDKVDPDWRELYRLQGERAIAAFFAVQPVPLEAE